MLGSLYVCVYITCIYYKYTLEYTDNIATVLYVDGQEVWEFHRQLLLRWERFLPQEWKGDRKMADFWKISPGYLPDVNVSRKSFAQVKIFIFLCILLVESGGATTHWVVTEDGKIQQQVRNRPCLFKTNASYITFS